MRGLRELLAVTGMSLLGIPKRPGSSSVIVVGIAGVVAVLICVFALAIGFTETAARTGRADRALILGRGALSEAASRLSRDNANTILDRPEISKGRGGKPIASAENLLSVRFTDQHTGIDSFATLRGVSPAAALLRPEVRLVAGRMFKPGVREIIVGRSAQRRLHGLQVGDIISAAQGVDWTIVGAFVSDEDTHESEMLTDIETLLSAFERNDFNSVTVLLDNPASFDSLRAALATNPSLSVDAKRESEYFAEASKDRGRLLKFIAYVIGGVMAFGAIFAAVNAMYSAIGTRTVEIATLRAIGFSGDSVLVSVLVEALVLVAVGAMIGAFLAWFFFNGSSVSTLSGASPSPVTYSLHVTPALITLGIGCAALIGLVGGLIPAIRAATLPVATVINRR
jgi:putative ABC transport system permease protein